MTRGVAILGVLALVGVASSAQALVITGGPVYTLPGGGSCTASGLPGLASGATVSCSGIAVGSHTHVYYGIKNNSVVNGNALDDSGPSAAGPEVYRYLSSTSSAITYTASSTINNTLGSSTQAVSNRLIITRTSGTASVVATGGDPANNGNGDVERLFLVTTATLGLTVAAESSSGAISFGISNPQVYDPIHTPLGGTQGDHVNVDLAFYYSDCGDGVIDSPEVCDDGVANGTLASCCTTSCTYQTNGTACSDDGNLCTDDQCNGSSSVCQHPNNTDPCNDGLFCNGTDTCSGGACVVHAGDPCPGPDGDGNCAESCDEGADNCGGADPGGSSCTDGLFCNGADTCASGTCTVHLGDPCPGPDGDTNCQESCDEALDNCLANDPNGTTCRSSGLSCDLDETCSSGVCPPDVFKPGGTLCRAGSGNPNGGTVCDPDETCTGSSASCPVDTVSSSGTVCRPGSGDLCDPDETCSGTATVPCPVDTVSSAGTVCNPGSGDSCDPDETCSGTATVACPSDTISSAGTVCNPGSGDLCDQDEVCSGAADDPCPSDTFEPNTTVCNPGSGDSCDPDEFCPGTADGACPSDTIASAGTVCNPGSGDLCDPDETCSGSADDPCPSDSFEPASTVCRGAAFPCDAVEFCPGSADATCPVDVLEPDATSCNDGDPCTQNTTCLSGSCQGGEPQLCVDHFKCYKAKDLKDPKFVATTVTLVDQFGLIHDDDQFELKKPFLVCNPTDKDGEGIQNPDDHLTCYKVKGRDGKIDKSLRPKVSAHNQLGTVELELKKAFVVCVPSSKMVIP